MDFLKNISLSLSVVCIALVLVSGSSCSDSSKKDTANKPKVKKVLIETSFGNMKAILYDATPKHKTNFLKLVNEGFYDNLLFHRVINEFMIQGGDPDSRDAAAGVQLGNGGPGYTVDAEFVDTLFHQKGALAAARQGDDVNPMRASSGSQFYIVMGKPFQPAEIASMEQNVSEQIKNGFRQKCIAMPENAHLGVGIMNAMNAQNRLAYDSVLALIDALIAKEFPECKPYKYSQKAINAYKTVGGTPHLDGTYTVFGQIVEGLEVIDKIAATQVDGASRPLTDIKMKMRVIEE